MKNDKTCFGNSVVIVTEQCRTSS